jgi:methionine synthase II (cobalamin-independent)
VIDGLDADVTSPEAAGSRMEVLPKLAAAWFVRGIGPGAIRRPQPSGAAHR